MSLIAARCRLLGGATAGLHMALLASSPAHASCDVSANAVTCDSTTTTETANAGDTPASDRLYQMNVAATDLTATVNSGAAVTGYGLAFEDNLGTVSGRTLNVVNNGIIQVDAGNTPFLGGEAALNILAYGDTDLSYSGAGAIANLGDGFSTSGLFMEAAGSGAITANVGGDITAAGFATNGIAAFQDGLAGSIVITTTSGTTIRASSSGIYASETAGDGVGAAIVANSASILSVGTPGTLGEGIHATSNGLGAVSVENDGAIGSATDAVAGVGITAGNYNAASHSAVQVTGSGAIAANNFGIFAQTLGTGSVIVDYSGAIDSNLYGISASSTSGEISITSGAVSTLFSNAVDAHSTSGAQTITVEGPIFAGNAGVNASSESGAITVNANGSIHGYDGIRLDSSGAKIVNVQAGSSVVGTNGSALRAAGGGTAQFNIAGSVGSQTGSAVQLDDLITTATINVASGGVLNGAVSLADGDDRINNSGTWNLGGASLPPRGLSNDDDVDASWLSNAASASFHAGTDSVNNLAGGVINLAAGASFSGLESYNNNAGATTNVAGTVDLGGSALNNGGTIRAEGGLASINAVATLANSGTIDLQDGAANDILTITGNFAGSGGSAMEIDVAGTAADRLVISGESSGSTRIDISLAGPVVINPDGVLVVDSGTSSVGAFLLGSQSTGNPLVSLGLEQRGQDYYLVALPSEQARDAIGLPGLAADLWHQSAEVYANYAAARRSDLDRGRAGPGVWGQSYFTDDRNGNDRVETRGRGIQAGVDYNLGTVVIGATAGWQKARFDRQQSDAGFKGKGWNAGLYGILLSDVGFHAGLLLKHDSSSASASENSAMANVDHVGLKSNGIAAEAGYRLGAGDRRVDLGGGLSWVRSKIDDFTSAGIDFVSGTASSLRGRAGFRVQGGGKWSPFVSADALHEFSGDNKVAIGHGNDADLIGAKGRGSWVRFEVGIGSSAGSGPIAAAWGEAGDVQGVGVKLGWRFGGAVAENARR